MAFTNASLSPDKILSLETYMKITSHGRGSVRNVVVELQLQLRRRDEHLLRTRRRASCSNNHKFSSPRLIRWFLGYVFSLYSDVMTPLAELSKRLAEDKMLS
ncbi:hypothetical protein MLD38_002765 [Melastoma candidum]|uniref:Uncharacterized protein n=1 Tax=Melastoma candidum TaxID=119954 RepID=A0ACB9S029_9MYRT|nr:hypothetical protein MLD38_002765 [Melastoma candidum]